MAKIVEYLDPINLVYTTDYSEMKVGYDFRINSEPELVQINPIVFDEEPSAADLNALDEEQRITVRGTGAYILCIESDYYGRSSADVGVNLWPCYVSENTKLTLRYSQNTSSVMTVTGERYPYLCAYKVASDEKGLRLARCGDLAARPDAGFGEKYYNSETMSPGEYVEFAEESSDDEEITETTVIKAGRYKFADELETAAFFEIALPITVGDVDYAYLVNDVSADDSSMLKLYYLNSADDCVLAYSSEAGEGISKGWQTEDLKIFTVRFDTEVKLTDGVWFDASTEVYNDDGEEDDEDTSSMMLIKAGTYRFNDELNFLDGDGLDHRYDFTFILPSIVYNGEIIPEAKIIGIFPNAYAGTMVYYTNEDSTAPIYTSSNRFNNFAVILGDTSLNGYGQIIRVPNDFEAEDVIGTWFTENTTMLIKAGTYRWNDALTDFFTDNNYTAIINFTAPEIVAIPNEDNTVITFSLEGIASFANMTHFISAGSDEANLVYNTADDTQYFGYNSENGWNSCYSFYSNLLTQINATTTTIDVLKGYGQIITVTADQYVPTNFGLWANENCQPYEESKAPTAESVTAKILSLIDKSNATTGKGDTDLTKAVMSLVAGYGQGGGSGECSGDHIIEVEELPTEGIVPTNLYKMGGTYYKYSDAFKDILIVQDGQVQSFVEVYTGMGAVIELYYAKTRPTENIVVSGETTDGILFACYYVENENDILAYGDFAGSGTNEWMSLITSMEATNGGAITDVSQATENGTTYALVEQGWKPLGAAEYKGEVVIE